MTDKELHRKVDTILEKINFIEVNVAVIKSQVDHNTDDISENRKDWKEHMRKTVALERQAEVMQKIFAIGTTILTVVATAAGAVYTFTKLFS